HAFRMPGAYAFNSVEEKELLLKMAGVDTLPGEVVGVGIEDSTVVPADEIRKRLDVLGDYIVYVGRIEREKGCSRLFEDFLRYVQERAPHLSLVLVGKAVLPIPVHTNVTHLGILSDAEKLSVIGASRLLVHPSAFESLSMALLEAWKMERPALVNGRCAVMRGQVQRANGGLYYASYEEFAEALGWLLAHPRDADALGRSGRTYYETNYAWPVIMEKYERLLASVHGRCPFPPAAALLRHPALRRRGRGRLRAALPLAGRTPGAPARRPRRDDVRPRLPRMPQPLPAGRGSRRRSPRHPPFREAAARRASLRAHLRPRLPRGAHSRGRAAVGGRERARESGARALPAWPLGRGPLRLLLVPLLPELLRPAHRAGPRGARPDRGRGPGHRAPGLRRSL